MINVIELSNKFLKNTLEENLLTAKLLLSSLLTVLPSSNQDEINMSNCLIANFCFQVIASDGVISDKETEFFNKLMDVNYDSELIKSKIKMLDSSTNLIKDYIKDFDSHIKEMFAVLTLLFAASDGEVSKEELELVNKIIE